MTLVYPLSLRGDRVVLREFCDDDLDAVAAIVGDERVTDWLSFDRRSRSEAEAMLAGVIDRARRDPRDEYYLAITSPPDDAVVGFGRLARSGVQAGKLGFAVDADHWGQGLATEAATTIITFGFADLGLHRVSAAVGPANKASIAIATKLGMTQEGRLRDHVLTNGAWRDSLLFSILAHEWAL